MTAAAQYDLLGALIEPLEEWRPVAGFDGYEVSSLGRVRSWRPVNGRGGLASEPRIRRLATNRGGYRICQMMQDGLLRPRFVHHLVLDAFVGPRPTMMHMACHWDGDRANNLPGNLRWGTAKDNSQDSIRHGTFVSGDRHPLRLNPERVQGERNGRSVVTEENVREARSTRMTYRQVMQRWGLSRASAQSLVYGKSWRHVK